MSTIHSNHIQVNVFFSECTVNETKLIDIFKINKQDQLTRDMKDVALQVLINKIPNSNSPEIQF